MTTAHDKLREKLPLVAGFPSYSGCTVAMTFAHACDVMTEWYTVKQERAAALAQLAEAKDAAAADRAVAVAAEEWFKHRQQHHDHECDGADCRLFAALDARPKP